MAEHGKDRLVEEYESAEFFRQSLAVDQGRLNYNPTDTPLFNEMVSTFNRVIEQDKAKGLIYEPKVRWDLKDQQEFDQVPFEELLDNPYYGGGRYYVEQIGEITKEHPGLWPEHRQDLIDLEAARTNGGTVDTFVDIEGIGSGKTHKFRTSLRVEVLRVLTRVNPLEFYGLDPGGQGISFVCMSRNATLAKQVTFSTVLKAFDCPFFNNYFPPQVDIAKIQDSGKYPSILRFPKDVVIFPGSGSALSAIGYNLMGGGVDEANYLEVVERSKKAVGNSDYDAAETMYGAIYSRMLSRFAHWIKKEGKLPGLLSLFSNPRHSTDFLERMALRAKNDRNIFLRRRCTWEGHPESHYTDEVFYFDRINRRICNKDGTPLDGGASRKKTTGGEL